MAEEELTNLHRFGTCYPVMGKCLHHKFGKASELIPLRVKIRLSHNRAIQIQEASECVFIEEGNVSVGENLTSS